MILSLGLLQQSGAIQIVILSEKQKIKKYFSMGIWKSDLLFIRLQQYSQ